MRFGHVLSLNHACLVTSGEIGTGQEVRDRVMVAVYGMTDVYSAALCVVGGWTEAEG